jgi:hypothetical protein
MTRKIGAVFVALALAGAGLWGCDEGGDDLPLRPQIMPHLNPINACEVWLGDGGEFPAQHWTFDLMLQNQGREELQITGFDVLHDQRCGFAPPLGDVRIFDDDSDDEFMASARKLDAAFMRIEYTPPGDGVDEAEIVIHSNAENFPDLSIYVCAAGTSNTTISCRIRVDPDCEASGVPCQSDADCPVDSEQCIFPEVGSPEGECACRPCGMPPDEEWPNCDQGGGDADADADADADGDAG